MCGIAAIYAYHYAALEVNREELQTIRDYMVARGPDGKGEWYSNNGRVGLAHRRLSIIDLSERAAQPMSNDDGSIIISFNGEIYNYKELRKGLEGKGYLFRSDSDTEVLLRLYEDQGRGMVKHLRGMFAFAIWHGKKKTMLLARDPYGIKPLYYADDGWTVRVASQVKALLAGGKVSTNQEPAGIAGFYLFGHVPEPFTRYQEIRSVPAGSTVEIGELGANEPESYFSIAEVFKNARMGEDRLTQDEMLEQVREALHDSVAHHLIADVDVGAFLSSGVDSGAIVGLAAEIRDQSPLSTLTLAFEEFRNSKEDEAPLAEKIARQYGTRHTKRIVTEKEFGEDIPKILEAMDQPSIDGVNTWFVSKAARELGLKVCLSGLGGDELFGGYPSFRDIPRWVRAFYLPSRIPLLGDLFRVLSQPLLTRHYSPKAAGLFKLGGFYPGAYLLRRGLFMPWELKDVIGEELAREGLRRLSPLRNIKAAMSPDPGTGFGRIASMEASQYMRNQLLRDADWAGMAHSLEIRVPLVDNVLLQRLAPLVQSLVELQGKEALASSPRQALPRQVVERAKTGFCTPVRGWLAKLDSLQEWKRIPKLKQAGCHWSRRWAYTVGELHNTA